MICSLGYEREYPKQTLIDNPKNAEANITQLFVFVLVVVQLHPGHSEKRERPAYSGGAAALRCGQSGASCGYCPTQPGHGQKE